MNNGSSFLRGAFDDPNYPFTAGPNNNYSEKSIIEKQYQTLKAARNGGTRQAIKKAISHLPYNPQSLSTSPYFDTSLFSFDEKIVSCHEKPKQASEFPVKFYSRKTGRLKFKLLVGTQIQQNNRLKYELQA